MWIHPRVRKISIFFLNIIFAIFFPFFSIVHRYHTTTTIDNKPCYIEIIDIPGFDTNGCFASEWISVLDGIIIVYSAESLSSLLLLERKYAQLIPQMVGKDMHQIPV